MATAKALTRAQIVAWEIYVLRVQSMMSEQLASYRDGHPPVRITLVAPLPEHVAVIDRAIEAAHEETRKATIHQVLGPVVTAIDSIDNSEKAVKKTPAVRELYAALSGVYDALHALKRESVAPVTSTGGDQ